MDIASLLSYSSESADGARPGAELRNRSAFSRSSEQSCPTRHFSSFTERLLYAWNCAAHCEYSAMDKTHTLPHEFVSVVLSPPGGLH